jgi:adenosylhomocysteine nucleosidase
MSLKVLVVAALSWEARQVMRHVEALRSSRDGGFALWSGHHRGVEVSIVQTGIGPERAARALSWVQRSLRPDAVLSTGCAGGLTPGLVPGEVVVCEEVITPDGLSRPTSIAWCERYGAAAAAAALPVRRGAILSNPVIVTITAEKRRLAAAAGALAVEMEAAAIAAWAAEIGAQFAAARVILDSAEMPIAADVAALTSGSGGLSPRRLLAAVTRRPSIVRDFLAIGAAARRCRAALDALHRELFRGL